MTPQSIDRPIPIEARAVTVKAGFKTLISSVSFTAHAGQVLAILGPSGAGKSTLFRALNGSSPPDSGNVFYGGTDLHDSLDRFRMQIGYVPQDDIVHDALTPEDVLYYSGRLRLPPEVDDDAVRQRAVEVLGLVELSERRDVKVRRLSGGQRKRVNLGVELMTRPAVLFLDEPTSGLDPALEEKMMDLFRHLARGGRTVLLTTHVTESLDTVDRVLLLCAGKRTYIGPPREALSFFGVQTFSDIYSKLTASGPDYWAREFEARGPSDVMPTVAGLSAASDAARPIESVRAAASSAEDLLAKLEREIEEQRRR